MSERRNKNRGYQQLRVWQDAIELYVRTPAVFRPLSFELRRVGSQALAASDSVHRSIAEGYCRRSIKEYIQHLYIALGSLGESVSGFHACRKAEQISSEGFEALHVLAYKLENGLICPVETLERKRDSGDWTDSMMATESNAAYGEESE